MTRDGVANIVSRLRECGFDPRKVGRDSWESRCPGHRSRDHALSIIRNEFNQVVLTCRSTENCQHMKIIRAVGFTNDQLYAETSQSLIRRLAMVEVQPSSFLRPGTPNVNDAGLISGERDQGLAEISSPLGDRQELTSTVGWAPPTDASLRPRTVGGAHPTWVDFDAPLALEELPNADQDDRRASRSPQITASPPERDNLIEDASPASGGVRVTAGLVPDDQPQNTWEGSGIDSEANRTASALDHERSQAVALASDGSAVDTVKESPTDALMRMAGVDRVILGSDGRSYALVSVNGQDECRELKSKALRNLLTHAALKATGKLPTPEAIAAVVGVLEASAEFGGARAHVFLRVARSPSGSSYFLDLADSEGRIVEIRADGWAQITAPPVFFRRAAGQLELPVPARGGSLELLKKYVNIEDADWPLFVGWLTAAMRPVGPHPILVLTGEQGAAKTTMLRVCRRLIDPNASPVRAQPKELRDLMIAARKSWLMAYDNITTLPPWLSNGLCGLATGTGFTVRSLGTDDDEIIFVAQRPIIINGINDFVEKADLGDRSFFVHLPRISRSMRRTEEAFWEDFDRDCPLILGGLLDAVSAGMRTLPSVYLPGLSRMADAERWGEAVARGFGWAPGTFANAFAANRAATNEWTLEESPVAVALIDLTIRCPQFRGTMQELLEMLVGLPGSANVRSADWPKSPRALSVKLRHLAPQLQSIGIDVAFERDNMKRFVTVAMVQEKATSGTDHDSPLIGQRFRAYIEEQNRSVPPPDQSGNTARPIRRGERVTQTSRM